MAEVIGAELGFEAVLGPSHGRGHHARVVDKNVDPLEPLVRLACCRANRIE